MAWGDRAAEQYEKDQPSEPIGRYSVMKPKPQELPSTCLRPDGASPELPPLKDRNDFLERMEVLRDVITEHGLHQLGYPIGGGRQSYHAERQRAAEAKADQLVLMRAKQIMDEAEQRRNAVLRKLAKTDD